MTTRHSQICEIPYSIWKDTNKNISPGRTVYKYMALKKCDRLFWFQRILENKKNIWIEDKFPEEAVGIVKSIIRYWSESLIMIKRSWLTISLHVKKWNQKQNILSTNKWESALYTWGSWIYLCVWVYKEMIDQNWNEAIKSI